ncbi:GNAT family N-acetyltransferase [Deinococcus lacus]|uniref:GNAT family N-acetyltransferase n=1 Tax=Deinococcus lacus TaxID=392561 RepID=A0ABW1YDH9_9DEIO
MSFSLRPRRPDDLPALLEVLRAAFEQHGYPAEWPEDPYAFMSPPGAYGWVAVLDGETKPAAQILLRPVERDPRIDWEGLTGHPPEDIALLARLFVDPRASGLGIARALLDQAVAAGRAEGRFPALDVYPDSERATSIYERMGWRKVGEYTGYWLRRGEHPLVYVYLPPEAEPAGAR